MGENMTIKTLAIIHELLTERVHELEERRYRASAKLDDVEKRGDHEEYIPALEEELGFVCRKLDEAKYALHDLEAHDFR